MSRTFAQPAWQIGLQHRQGLFQDVIKHHLLSSSSPSHRYDQSCKISHCCCVNLPPDSVLSLWSSRDVHNCCVEPEGPFITVASRHRNRLLFKVSHENIAAEKSQWCGYLVKDTEFVVKAMQNPVSQSTNERAKSRHFNTVYIGPTIVSCFLQNATTNYRL